MCTCRKEIFPIIHQIMFFHRIGTHALAYKGNNLSIKWKLRYKPYWFHVSINFIQNIAPQLHNGKQSSAKIVRYNTALISILQLNNNYLVRSLIFCSLCDLGGCLLSQWRLMIMRSALDAWCSLYGFLYGFHDWLHTKPCQICSYCVVSIQAI